MREGEIVKREFVDDGNADRHTSANWLQHRDGMHRTALAL